MVAEIGGYIVKNNDNATKITAVIFHQSGFTETILGNILNSTAPIIAPNIIKNFILIPKINF